MRATSIFASNKKGRSIERPFFLLERNTTSQPDWPEQLTGSQQ
jgi:hypothetical protein